MAAALTEEQKAQKAADAQKAKDQKAADKAAAKKAADEAKAAAKAAKPASVKQNGIARPNKGKTLRIWEIADEISKTLKSPAPRKAVTEKASAEGLELGTIHTQYGRWRKFHGLSSVRAVPSEEKGASAKAADKPLTPAQQKKADAAAQKAASK